MPRLLSLLIGAVLAIGLMLLPAVRGRELTHAGHGLLTPLLLAVCALFVHGLGFRPSARWLDRLLAPWLLWPLALGLAAMWWRWS